MMTKIVLTAALALALVVTGTAAAADNLTIALLDCSGSMLQGGATKDSPFNRNLEELKAEIRRLNKKNSMIVLGFGKKSDVQLLKVEMPRIAGPGGINLSETREGAIKKMLENIRENTGAIDKSRTDLIGALARAARIFSESGAQSKRLILLSDTVDNETIGLNLKRLTAGSHTKYLKRLDTLKVPYPDLKSVAVDVYAVLASEKDMNGLQTEIAISELKSLWGEYFKRSGTEVSSYRTSIY